MAALAQSARARIDWVAAGAIALVAVFMQPAIHAAYRADDTWNSVVRGKLTLVGVPLPEHLWQTAEHFFTSTGRPNVLGTTQGLFTAWFFDPHVVAYHAFIVVLTAIAAGVLYALAREFGLTRGGALLVVVLVAGAIQFRSYHDAALGYSGSMQIVIIFLLLSLILFMRALRRDDGRLMVASVLLFLPCPLIYEGAYPMVVLYLGIALMERRGWAAVRASLPFLALGAIFVGISLVGRAMAPSVVPGYEVGSSPWAALKTYVIQLFAPIPASNVFFAADYGSFLPIGGNPTKAELLGAAWRGLAIFALVLVLSLRLAGHDGAKLPPARTLWGLATCGALLWITSVLVISAAPKYQTELVAGKGHLPTLVQVFGWGLLATAALLALLRTARGRSTTAVRVVAGVAAALLGFAAGVVGFNNMRVVALETPIAETRALLERATADGVFANLPRDSSLIFTTRDLRWSTGSWAQVPDAIESMLVQRGEGRRLDGRIVEPTDRFDCPRSRTFPPADCEPLAPVAAWVRVRARPGGGSVVVAPFKSDPDDLPALAPALLIRAYVEDDEKVSPPRLVGRDAAAQPWRSNRLRWREIDHGDGWAIYQAPMAGRLTPLGSSLDDVAGKIDFTAPLTPDQIVRIYGTKRLLP